MRNMKGENKNMIMLPPEELTVYLSVGENGEWIHDPDMPTELEEIFQKFVKEETAIRQSSRKEDETSGTKDW